MRSFYYCDPAQNVLGPLPEDELLRLERERVIFSSTLVCPPGADQWVSWAEVRPDVPNKKQISLQPILRQVDTWLSKITRVYFLVGVLLLNILWQGLPVVHFLVGLLLVSGVLTYGRCRNAAFSPLIAFGGVLLILGTLVCELIAMMIRDWLLGWMAIGVLLILLGVLLSLPGQFLKIRKLDLGGKIMAGGLCLILLLWLPGLFQTG